MKIQLKSFLVIQSIVLQLYAAYRAFSITSMFFRNTSDEKCFNLFVLLYLIFAIRPKPIY